MAIAIEQSILHLEQVRGRIFLLTSDGRLLRYDSTGTLRNSERVDAIGLISTNEYLCWVSQKETVCEYILDDFIERDLVNTRTRYVLPAIAKAIARGDVLCGVIGGRVGCLKFHVTKPASVMFADLGRAFDLLWFERSERLCTERKGGGGWDCAAVGESASWSASVWEPRTQELWSIP